MSHERKLRGIRRMSSTPFQFQDSRDVTSSGTGLKIFTHAQEGCCQLPRKEITDWSMTFPLMDTFTELFEQPSYKSGVGIIQANNGFSDKYMVPINSESFKTPSLTPNTLPNSKQIFFYIFSKISIRYQNFEHLL